MFHSEDAVQIIWKQFLTSTKPLLGRFTISWGLEATERVYRWNKGDAQYVMLPYPVSLTSGGQFTLAFSHDRPDLGLSYSPDFDDAIFHILDSTIGWRQKGNMFTSDLGDTIFFHKADDGIQIVGTVDIGGEG